MKTKNKMAHRPCGWRILLEIKNMEETTDGGIIIPKKTKNAAENATVLATVVAMGEMAYKRDDMREYGPWCEVGDTVLLEKFAGKKYEIDGKTYKVVNDDEIIIVTDKPEEIARSI